MHLPRKYHSAVTVHWISECCSQTPRCTRDEWSVLTFFCILPHIQRKSHSSKTMFDTETVPVTLGSRHTAWLIIWLDTKAAPSLYYAFTDLAQQLRFLSLWPLRLFKTCWSLAILPLVHYIRTFSIRTCFNITLRKSSATVQVFLANNVLIWFAFTSW